MHRAVGYSNAHRHIASVADFRADGRAYADTDTATDTYARAAADTDSHCDNGAHTYAKSNTAALAIYRCWCPHGHSCCRVHFQAGDIPDDNGCPHANGRFSATG